MNKFRKGVLDALWFVIVFLLIQIVFQFGAVLVDASQAGGVSLAQIQKSAASVAMNGKWITVITAVSSMLTILLFVRLKWTILSKTYLRSHPWAVCIWVVLLTIGTVLPAEWIYEQMQIALPEGYAKLFENVMKEPWGYVAIGLLAPLAEEIVFRGAVLRALLGCFGEKKHWIAIVLSALIFGFIHFNIAQGVHAFIIGLLLGWMYYRTGSLVPGIILHWINNTIAYVMFNIMPQMADGKLIDFFHGDDKLMIGGLICSLCILIPSLFQLTLRMKRIEQ